MKKTWVKVFAFLIAIAFFVPGSLMAQDDKGDKGDKGEKGDKDKDVQNIIVTRKGKTENKVTIEINGDKVTINGKPLDEYKDKDGDISVKLQKFKELDALARVPWSGYYNSDGENDMELFGEGSNHAMLGVTTEKADEGVEIQDITKESAAQKAGLKEGDIITKINDKKIEDPDDLSEVIKSYKPGEKVTVTFLRDKKEQKVTAELGKWKGMGSMSFGPHNFKMDMGDMDMKPRIEIPNYNYNYKGNWNWSDGSPKLGLSVQDSDDGKGVKVIAVDEESNAEKAGIKEEDIITEVDGKPVNGADEIAKVIKESKTKISVPVKLLRDGKPMNIDVKMPRKLKKADL